MSIAAGRELDAAVAEKVMGLVVCRTKADIPDGWRLDNGQTVPGYRDGTFVYTLPSYSTSIEAAWQIVERLREKGWMVTISVAPDQDYAVLVDRRGTFITECEDSAALAICKAALAGVD